MRILITGASGFVAGHLQAKLFEHEVFMTSRNQKLVATNSHILSMDLESQDSIVKVLMAVEPQVIVHLAAQSNVPHSWDNPVETITANTVGTINLIESLNCMKVPSKVILVSSSDVYGLMAKQKRILNENDSCLPQNPYSVSKLAAEQITVLLSRKLNLDAICLRPFNHFGPGQRKGFVVSDFCSQIASIETGKQEPVIRVGDISTYRDFLPVSDVVNAYIAAITQAIPNDIYNISSGEPISINAILEKLISFSNKEITIQQDQERFRAAEIKSFSGDSSKFRSITNWKPVNNFDDCLLETLNWWRKK